MANYGGVFWQFNLLSFNSKNIYFLLWALLASQSAVQKGIGPNVTVFSQLFRRFQRTFTKLKKTQLISNLNRDKGSEISIVFLNFHFRFKGCNLTISLLKLKWLSIKQGVRDSSRLRLCETS